MELTVPDSALVIVLGPDLEPDAAGRILLDALRTPSRPRPPAWSETPPTEWIDAAQETIRDHAPSRFTSGWLAQRLEHAGILSPSHMSARFNTWMLTAIPIWRENGVDIERVRRSNFRGWRLLHVR